MLGLNALATTLRLNLRRAWKTCLTPHGQLNVTRQGNVKSFHSTERLRAFEDMSITEKTTTIKIKTMGFVKENITVQVEDNWVTVEAVATAVKDAQNGGFTQRHMLRRYELPNDSDFSRIVTKLDHERDELVIEIPRKNKSSG